MSSENFQPLSPSPAVTAVGIKHVMLTYHYRDVGDIEGYASLLDRDVEFKLSDCPHRHGRVEVVKAQAALATPYARHELFKVVAEGDTVVVLGRMVGSAGVQGQSVPGGVDFADIFTLSDDSLVLGCRRYHYLSPPKQLGV
jgi:hypothetical protein